MSKKLNIVIVNAHWSNRGDEAALRALLNRILEKWDCRIKVIFKDSEEVKQFPYQGDVTCFSAKFLPQNFLCEVIAVLSRGKLAATVPLQRTIDLVRGADVIIYAPGGAVICDRFWWRKQLEYLLPFLCAKFYRIPIFVAAPSMGPFEKNSGFRNRIIRWLLKASETICVRETITKKYLAGIRVTENVAVTIDTAFYDEPDREENEEILRKYKALEKFLQRYKKIVGMTISDFSWHIEYSKNTELKDQIEGAMGGFIAELEKKGIGVLLIPQLFGNQNDTKLLQKFQRSNTFLMSDEADTYFQQYIISKLYAVVGDEIPLEYFRSKGGHTFSGGCV